MLTFIQNSRQNTVDTPLSQEELLIKILSHANKSDLIKFIKAVEGRNMEDLESTPATDSLTFSPKIAKELNGFFDKISENLDALFYKRCQSDKFLPEFYKAIELASRRLESRRDLKPELRLELQPSAYSGFDDKLSKQDFANILFVIAIANYASDKSQGQIEENRFMDVLELMDKQKIKQEEEILRMPKSKAVMPHPNLFFGLACLLNVTIFSSQVYSLCIIRDKMNRDINRVIGTHNNLERIFNHMTEKILSRNNYTNTEIEIIRHNQTDLLASDLAKYNATQADISNMFKNRDEKMIVPALELAESASRMIADYSIHNANTRFLLFVTSLIFASESMAEIISNKNLVKTFSTYDEPTSVDNRLLVDGIRLALFVASQFDRRFGIDQIADRMIGGFSSLGAGLVNCAKSLFKSKEGQDLESGPLLETRSGDISPDQIKALAGEFSKLLAISTSTPELIASTPTPPLDLRASTPPSEVRLSSSNSAVENKQITLTK